MGGDPAAGNRWEGTGESPKGLKSGGCGRYDSDRFFYSIMTMLHLICQTTLAFFRDFHTTGTFSCHIYNTYKNRLYKFVEYLADVYNVWKIHKHTDPYRQSAKILLSHVYFIFFFVFLPRNCFLFDGFFPVTSHLASSLNLGRDWTVDEIHNLHRIGYNS